MSNSFDPDQDPHSVGSDLELFAKSISRKQESLLAGKEFKLISFSNHVV